MVDVGKLFEGIKSEASDQLENEIEEFLGQAKQDADEFIQFSAMKIEKYLRWWIKGTIDREQFMDLVEAISIDMTKLIGLHKSQEVVHRLQWASKKIITIFILGLAEVFKTIN